MFLQALLAFLALPGLVAYAGPLLLAHAQSPQPAAHGYGLLLVLAGSSLLLWCVRDFYVAGRGTLAPWAPPRTLVVVGLYRYSRNPMYLAVLTVLAGWALSFHSSAHLIYTAIVATAFQLRVVYGEEPWLAKTHGKAWAEYQARVPRWLY